METTVDTPKKALNGGWMTRRRLWFCCALFFVAGLLLGAVAGILVMHHHLRFPPPLDKLSGTIVARIQKDFTLSPAATKELTEGVRKALTNLHSDAIATWKKMDAELLQQVENLSPIFPEGDARDRWLRDYRKYFPAPPPPPPPLP